MSINAFDFLLDMALGYVDVDLDENAEKKPNNIDITSVLDVQETNKIIKSCSVNHASIGKLLKKRKNNVKKNETSTDVVKISKSTLFCDSLKSSFSRIFNFFNPETQRERHREFFKIVEDINEKNIDEIGKFGKEMQANNILYEIQNKQIIDAKAILNQNFMKDDVMLNNEKNKIMNENTQKKSAEDLQLFLNYIVSATKEFTDEEIMEFEIKMLKVVRNIKGKRELKQNIKKYCSAINFGESSIF